jgi:hypothetical protein
MYGRAVHHGPAVRRGTLAIPLLLAAAQMLIAMIVFRILQLVSFVQRLDFGRGAAAFSVRT